MQDFNYDFTNAMELTIEVSCCKYPERNRLLGGLQCPLVFFTWLLDHVIYLKLRKKEIFSLKITTFFTQDHFVLSFCGFAQLSKELFLSQLEINHLIQQLTEEN